MQFSTDNYVEQDSGSGIINSDNGTSVADDIDECEVYKGICGLELGCENTIGSFLCRCPIDLVTVEPNTICHKHSEAAKHFVQTVCVPDRHSDVLDSFPGQNTSTATIDLNVSSPAIDAFVPAPTDGSFGSHQLLGMLSTSKGNTVNGTDLNGTQYQNSTTVYSLQSTVGSDPQVTLLLACFLAISMVALISLATCIWRRRRRHLPWMPFCFVRERPGITTAGTSLGKCMQQYVTNPNYYSSSPDGSLHKILRDMEIPHESITFLEEIGEGCFGKVHKGLYCNNGVTIPVAVKILKEAASPEAEAEFEREVEIMSAFRHEHILKLLGVVFRDSGCAPWMVFEYMQYGDLAQLLRSNSPDLRQASEDRFLQLKPSDLTWVATQIACGMVYLTSQHFVHRDLATRNCLVDDKLTVKISDFGMSRDIYTSDYYKIGGSRMLPIRWMAPESITYGKFSLESDVWSYGVVLWEIFTFGKQPYYGHSNDEVVKLILQGILLSPPENCPPFVYNIMAGCWKTEPRDRLTFPEIYNLLVPHSPRRGRECHRSTNDEEERDMMLDNDNYLVPNAVTVL